MATSWLALWAFLVLGCTLSVHGNGRTPLEGTILDEDRAKAYLEEANVLLTDMCHRSVQTEWNYGNNLTEYNKNKSVEQTLLANMLGKEVWKNATQFKWTTFKDDATRLVFKRFSVLGTAILPDDKQSELVQIVADMSSNHGKAKICPFVRKTNTSDECNIPLEPSKKYNAFFPPLLCATNTGGPT